MLTVIGIYLIGVCVALIWVMVRDHQTGRCEMLSVRNMAVIGFMLFQLTSASMTLFHANWGPYFLTRPEWTALEYAAMVTVFLPVAFWAYDRGWVVRRLAHTLPTIRMVPNDSGMLAMAFLVMLLAAALRLGAGRIYLIGFVAGDVATGLAAVSTGLAGWVWAKRLFNPAIAATAVMMFLANVVIVLSDTYGRRGLVAVGAGLVWGMYFSQWRFMPAKVFLKRLVLVSIGPIIIVAVFSSVRGTNVPGQERLASDYVRAMFSGGSIGAGMLDLLGGQECAAGSMWLIESHKSGGGFEHRHMFTPWFFLIYPVPRAIWPDKPYPMGQHMPTYARMQNVHRQHLNIGPGIIGNAGCEGGWYAVIVYAVLGGLFLRFFDEAVRHSNYSPFVVLPLGSALGHILGLARGETSAFAALTVITVGGSLIIMVCIGKLIENVTGGSSVMRASDNYDDEHVIDDGFVPDSAYAAAGAESDQRA